MPLKAARCMKIPYILIPQHLRDDFFEEYGIRIEGNLSPLNIMRLEEEYGGRH